MRRYRFSRQVEVAARPEAVFDVLVDTGSWPAWWPSLTSVETLQDGEPLERIQRFTVQAPFGYRIHVVGRFTALDRPRLIAARLDGDLLGEGRMRLDGDGPTLVGYEIDVSLAATWMNALAPLLGPLFRRNHDRVVDAAFAALRARLNAHGEPD